MSDEDIRRTIFSAPSVLTPRGAVIWTRGAFRDRDLRPQVRQWFEDAGFVELAFESEPGGYGVGVNRIVAPATIQPVPAQPFTFNR